jgi:hypothetical protein
VEIPVAASSQELATLPTQHLTDDCELGEGASKSLNWDQLVLLLAALLPYCGIVLLASLTTISVSPPSSGEQRQ